MNLADIVGGQVVIHPDMLAIPPFKKLWDSFKDKDLATKYLWYIVLKNKYDSPYVETMERDQLIPMEILMPLGGAGFVGNELNKE